MEAQEAHEGLGSWMNGLSVNMAGDFTAREGLGSWMNGLSVNMAGDFTNWPPESFDFEVRT